MVDVTALAALFVSLVSLVGVLMQMFVSLGGLMQIFISVVSLVAVLMQMFVSFGGLMQIFISLPAVVVAFMQVAPVQQYAATLYNHSRCSARTMGGWAERTRRKFIWRENKFKIIFSTPMIAIDHDDGPPSSELPDSQHNEPAHHVVRVDAQDATTAWYSLRKGSGRTEWHRIEEKEKEELWFLRSKGTVDGSRCLWLDFLEDIAYTNLRITLTEQRSSYDFMSDGLQRPVAAVDGSSFLTIMSLFGIQWTNRGNDGKFTGVTESGFGEVLLINIFNFGDVYQYRRRNPLLGWSAESNADFTRMRFIIPSERVSEQAKLAMFNCFDFDFATIRTYDSLELGDSLRMLPMSEEIVRKFESFFDCQDGWVPGVRDAVACWAAPSMPKVKYLPNTEEGPVEFKSVFSARFAVPFSSEPGIAAMLIGGDYTDSHYKSRYEKVGSIQMLTIWAEEYLDHLAAHHFDTAKVVKNCLSWIASKSPTRGNVMTAGAHHSHVSYSLSMQCMKGILDLDEYLDGELSSQGRERAREIKLKFCLEQIQCQCDTNDDFHTASQQEGTSWHLVADKVASGYYCALPPKIAEFFDAVDALSAEKRAQRMVVNRLMRAALWAVHNGNAPNPNERSLQCSLSSRWLQQHFTISLQ